MGGREEDLEDSIPDIAGNVDLVVVGVVDNLVRDILRVAVGVLFGVEACRSQDEVVGIGVDHPIGIAEEVDGFASHAVEEVVAAAGEEVVDVVGRDAAAAGLVEVVE